MCILDKNNLSVVRGNWGEGRVFLLLLRQFQGGYSSTGELMPNRVNMPIKVPLRSGLQANRKTVGTEQSSSSPSPCQHRGESILNWGRFRTTQGHLAMCGDTADCYD